MKKIITNLLCLILIIPAFLTGCSKELPVIDNATYLDSTVTANVYNSSTTRQLTLSDITANTLDTVKLDRYTEFNITCKSTWIYKMYVETISFYVYTTEASNGKMELKLSMTNLAFENDIKKPTDDFVVTAAFDAKKNNAQLVTLNIGRTVATTTGSKITIDINESTSNTLTDEFGVDTEFKWFIYGLKIRGESRSYS